MNLAGSFVASRKVVVFACLLGLLLCPVTWCFARPFAADAKAAPPAGDPIEPGIWRVAGIAPGTGTSDLEPLRTLIGRSPKMTPLFRPPCGP